MHIPREQQQRPVLPADAIQQVFASSNGQSSSEQATPSAGCGIFPSYPFSATIDFHSPALTGVTPDDSELPSHLPSVQIDYLSEWHDEEVCLWPAAF
jgi:hypothetical protein